MKPPKPIEPPAYGLLQISTPHQPAKANIVAVHGLNGHPFKTWTSNLVDPPFNWLDQLAKDIPQFRVFTFSYNASTHASISLDDIAKDLLSDLQLLLEQEKPNPLPLIFIAHSLGGLVVKQAVVRSSQSVSPLIHRSTAAILFFGTPHYGFSTSESSRIVAKIAAVALPAHDPLAFVLRETSERASSTNEAFFHLALAQSYEIASFYETRLTRAGAMSTTVVSMQDATLNLAGSRNYPVAASHTRLTKFDGPESETYQLVLSILRRIAIDVLLSAVRPPSQPPGPVVTGPPGAIPASRRIQFPGYVDLFRDGRMDSRGAMHPISDILGTPPSVLLESGEAEAPSSPLSEATPVAPRQLLYWVHLPLNNTAYVNPCLHRIVSDLARVNLSITAERYWLSHERSQQNIPHSRHFEPGFFLKSDTSSTQMVFYLPYIHWDLLPSFRRRADYLSMLDDGKLPDLPDGLPDRARKFYQLMRDDGNKATSLHPRRSLDQFFYSSLQDTRQRDEDQVVSKSTKESRGGPKMIMVDQLWLWLVESHDPKGSGPSRSAVFTCFPRKEQEVETANDEDLAAIADLRQSILDELDGDAQLANGANFVAVVIERAINVMLQVRNERSLDFLDVFRAAIGKLTEDQSSYFAKFQKGLDSKSEKVGDTETKREEVKLALELADVIDELNSIRRLFEAQEDVLKTAIRQLSRGVGRYEYESTCDRLVRLVEQDIDSYIKQVDRLTRDAQRTRDALMSLLDLQQKEDSLKEAIFSNDQALAAQEQAEETEAQSQILFLFTLVTIVFLPLSFFTSYYGMNVVELTGEEKNTNQADVWKVMGPFSAAIIFGLMGTAFVMYRRTRTQLRRRRKARRSKGQEPEPKKVEPRREFV